MSPLPVTFRTISFGIDVHIHSADISVCSAFLPLQRAGPEVGNTSAPDRNLRRYAGIPRSDLAGAPGHGIRGTNVACFL